MSIARDKRSDRRAAPVSVACVPIELWITGLSPHCLALGPHLIIHTVWNIFPGTDMPKSCRQQAGVVRGCPCGANLGNGDKHEFLTGALGLKEMPQTRLLSCSLCLLLERAVSKECGRHWTRGWSSWNRVQREHGYGWLWGQSEALNPLSSFCCLPRQGLCSADIGGSRCLWTPYFTSTVSIGPLLLPRAPLQELSSQKHLSRSLTLLPPSPFQLPFWCNETKAISVFLLRACAWCELHAMCFIWM